MADSTESTDRATDILWNDSGILDLPDTARSPIRSAFIVAVLKSGLVRQELLVEAMAGDGVESLDDQGLAQRLVDRHLLTPFQATRIFQGRGEELFVGDYRLVHKLHTGGVGVVFVARHAVESGLFAVKMLNRTRRTAQSTVDMFRIEALALTTLRHPNIVRGFEYAPLKADDDVGYFLAMEFVPGPDLSELLTIRRRLPVGQACDIIAQAARGLQHAHENNFLHRDVKPGNLLIDESGVAKLIDFGFARLTDKSQPFPVTPSLRPGTVGFYAPEAITSSKPRDHRSDIYSLGLTFYFALTGKSPFRRENDRETIRAQQREAPKPLAELRSDVPPGVVDVFERMTAADPAKRFESMREVAEALEPYAVREPVNINFQALLRARIKVESERRRPSAGEQAARAQRVEGEPPAALSDLKSLQSFVQRISDELAVRRAENQRLRDELGALRNAASSSAAQRTKLTSIQEHVQRLEEENFRLAAEAATANGRVAALTSRCTKLEAALAEYERQIQSLAARTSELSPEFGLRSDGGADAARHAAMLQAAYDQAGPGLQEHGEQPLENLFWDDGSLSEFARSLGAKRGRSTNPEV